MKILGICDNLLISEMENWAHEVRLNANDQRHADNTSELLNEFAFM